MFDLETAIANWRKQMLAAGIQSPVPLEELESHLREDVEQQVRSGTIESQAFHIAVQRIGQALTLKKEFMKTDDIKGTFLRKLKRFLLGPGDAPLPAVEDFAPAARQTLELAPAEARRFHHDFVGTEHILLGLIQSGSKTVGNVMRELGVDSEAVRLEIGKIVSMGPVHEITSKILLTPRAREALQLATEEARKLSQPRVKAEHIFLGLLREGSGVAALVLKKLGVQIGSVRMEILKELRANPDISE
jgi:Clp amino terminal domain, pathogenicity island component